MTTKVPITPERIVTEKGWLCRISLQHGKAGVPRLYEWVREALKEDVKRNPQCRRWSWVTYDGERGVSVIETSKTAAKQAGIVMATLAVDTAFFEEHRALRPNL